MNIQLSNKQSELTGIILSGGKSQRMGKDKGFVKIDGKSLIQTSIDIINPICSEIIISANSDDYLSLPYKIIKDEIKDLGPIGGIYSSLKKSNTELNLIIATDTPYINKELLLFLILNSSPNKISALVQPDSHIEPLCAIYPKSLLSQIEKFIKSGKRKLIDLLIELDYQKVELTGEEDFYNENLFRNLNRPEDIS